MNILGIGTVIETVGKLASDLITTDKEREELRLKEKEIDQRTDLAQIDVNKAEAANPSVFVSGWRPYIGWVGGAAMTYQFILYPLMQWGWALMQSAGWIPATLIAPPVLPSEQLWVILSGILGIAGMRTYEKKQGVA